MLYLSNCDIFSVVVINMNLKRTTTIMLICSFIVLLIVLSGCNTSQNYLIQINYETLKEKIDNKDDFVLYVSNKSCVHCKDFQPKLEAVINEHKVTIYKLSTDTMSTTEYDDFTGLVGKLGTPSTLFFYDGIESGTGNRISGNVKEDIIVTKLEANDYIKKAQ